MLPDEPAVVSKLPCTVPCVMISCVFVPDARYVATLALPYISGSPVNCDPLPRKYPLVTLPVVLIIFEPKLAIKVTTLASVYVAGKPVSCDPLPRKYPPVMLPVVDTTLDPKSARNVATLAFEYVAGKPVSCDPLPKM